MLVLTCVKCNQGLRVLLCMVLCYTLHNIYNHFRYNFNALGKISKLYKQQSQIFANPGHSTRNAVIFARNELFPLFLCLKILNIWNCWQDSGLSLQPCLQLVLF